LSENKFLDSIQMFNIYIETILKNILKNILKTNLKTILKTVLKTILNTILNGCQFFIIICHTFIELSLIFNTGSYTSPYHPIYTILFPLSFLLHYILTIIFSLIHISLHSTNQISIKLNLYFVIIRLSYSIVNYCIYF